MTNNEAREILNSQGELLIAINSSIHDLQGDSDKWEHERSTQFEECPENEDEVAEGMPQRITDNGIRIDALAARILTP